jgi:hypothetical protein
LAWLLAVLRPLPRETGGLLHLDAAGEWWMGFGQQGLGWRTGTLYGSAGLTDAGRASAAPLPGWIALHHPPPVESRAITTIGAGWPMIALRARRTGIGHDEPRPGTNAWHTGLGPQWVEWHEWVGALGAGKVETATDPDARLLPVGLYLPGFATNVAFWSAVCALPWALMAFRRRRRVRRGCCAKCGYDVRGDVTRACPECGHAIART